MRLDKIKLAGFKSFVDPTTIRFPSERVGVVGPNGCGKSNVIDAVRWVMGESSAKNLRGDSLTDVIFNGSKDRKPVGHATIELIFDNKAGKLGGQYAAFSEISVKRQLSRDGQSIYYLNGTRCRRRDITDLFLGTGLGPRSYAIIEQGTISRLIEAKPEELRVFLEEAAGISKYKERRRETENRIRHAKDNISRINDLIGELEKRLNTLQRQAKTAEKYKEMRKEERLVKAQLLALRWLSLDSESSAREKDIRIVDTELESYIAEMRGIEVDIEKRRAEQIELNEEFNVIQGQFYRMGAEISRLEQSIQHVIEKRQQDQQELTDIEQRWQEAQHHIEHDRQQQVQLQQVLDEGEPALNAANEAAALSADALASAEQAMQSWQQQWDEFNQRAADEMRRAEVERTRIEHLESESQRLQQRLERLLGEQQELQAGEQEQELTSLRSELQEYDQTIHGQQQTLQNVLSHISEQRDTNQQLTAQLREQREQCQTLEKRQASLEALQEAALGKHKGTVADWLLEHDLHQADRLAEVLDVESGWEQAVETVLGLHLEAVCIEGVEAVAREIHTLSQGTLTVFDSHASAVPGSHTEISAQPLAQRIKSNIAISPLLSGVYSVDTLEQALQLRSQLQAHESVVCQDGLWLGRDWLRISRPSDEKAGVLAREHELKLLSQQLAQSQDQLSTLEQQAQMGVSQYQMLEEERNTLQQALNQAAHQHAELRTKLSRREAHLEQLQQRRQRITQEIDEITSQTEHYQQELIETRTRLEAVLDQTSQHELQRDGLSTQKTELTQQLEQQRQQAQQDRDSVREWTMRLEATRKQLASLQSSLQRMEQQLAHLVKRREELTEALTQVDDPVASMQQELEQLLEQRHAIETKLSEERQRVADCEHALRELNDGRHFVEQKIQSKREDLGQLRLHAQEAIVRRQTIAEQINEAHEDRETLINELPQDASEPEWQQQVEVLEQRIQRLGAINLAAIEEFAEESERKTYLDSQAADLNEALDTLELAIRKIDQETKARFKATYETVNERLQELFPRVFGGGRAYLEMTSEDLLESGIAVMAQPPGKKNSSIHLLSGGEKALTAVALVFALFELNPAPFCMLDEVDAPLDDSNTMRFCQLVKEMSERVQFIFITHNKITMELADQLLGVTMYEPGVSRIVAVDVDEAAKLAEAV